MTWTYSGDPASSDRDAVRFLIGDTDTSDQQISDEEIAYLLTQWGSPIAAAAKAVRALAAKFSRLVDKAVGDLRISRSQRAKNYLDLAEKLELQASVSGGLQIYAGGISVSDKQTQEEKTDRVKPRFKIGQFDNTSSDTDDDD